MRLLKHKLIMIAAIILSSTIVSCEDNESGITFPDLDARFIVSNNEVGTVELFNTSTGSESFSWDFGDSSDGSTVANPTYTYEASGTYTITLTATDEIGNTDTFQNEVTVDVPVPFGGLLTNGDFELGAAPWIQGVDDNNPAPIITEGGNTFYTVNVTSPNPDAVFLVNLSQKLEIVQGQTYTLSFDAWTDQAAGRNIIAGIGLSGPPFSSTSQTVAITTTQTNYELTSLSSADFGAPDARVLFDLNGEAGVVNIDNVILTLND
ncbi:PKD domain-containing protein [Winogradskyella sp.]|uniref:PKD domain-containing protein n=1 Tax=Winogradskyella sp. TaxID=1883156 RepID=UPI00261B3044|nr:PKD domain-containing protein [Winogradskyella sp.]